MDAAPRALLLGLALCLLSTSALGYSSIEEVKLADLPREAIETVALIREGGPFPHRKDGVAFGNRERLLPRMQRALRFPEWFGRNWDALEDCLTDMSWHDDVGYVLLLDGGRDLRRHEKALFHTLVDVFKSAADYWRGAERPFWAFFLDVPPDATLPAFP